MSTNNQNKSGYIHTSLGWIPEQWEVKRLDQILIEGRLGGNYENSEANNGIPVIKMGNLERGKINTEKIQCLPESGDYDINDILKEGDLLFNTRNTLELVGKVAIWKNELPCAIYNSNIMRMKFNEKYVANNWFMNYSFNSHLNLSQLRGFATGTTSVAAIYGRDLRHLKIPLPPLPEQQKIAAILSTWDEAISKTQQLIAQLQQRNKGLMQQLLTGKKRLKGFEEKWNICSFTDCFKLIRSHSISRDGLSNNNNNEKIFCIHYGDIHASYKTIFLDFETEHSIPQIIDNDFAIKEEDLLKDGDIIIADASEDYEGVGKAIEVKNLNGRKAVGGLHTIVIREINGYVAKQFAAFLFNSEKIRNELRKKATGTSVYSVSKTTLKSLEFLIPTKNEQKVIAQFLFNSIEEISNLEEYLAILKRQKKGLMQKLLTGAVRVKI